MVVRAGGIQILNNVTGSAHGSLHVMITPLIHSTKLSHAICRISMMKWQINHTHLVHDAYANSPLLIFRSITSHTQRQLKARYTVTLFACGWAGAVIDKVTGAFRQEQWAQSAKKVSRKSTRRSALPVPCVIRLWLKLKEGAGRWPLRRTEIK